MQNSKRYQRGWKKEISFINEKICVYAKGVSLQPMLKAKPYHSAFFLLQSICLVSKYRLGFFFFPKPCHKHVLCLQLLWGRGGSFVLGL